MSVPVWRSEDNSMELNFSFHLFMGSGTLSWVPGFNLFSHVISSMLFLLNIMAWKGILSVWREGGPWFPTFSPTHRVIFTSAQAKAKQAVFKLILRTMCPGHSQLH